MKQLSSWARRFYFLWFSFALLACQGRGRVHEAPPASYPEDAPPSHPAETPSSLPDEPPPALPEAPEPPNDAFPPEQAAPPRRAEPEAKGESSAWLGRGSGRDAETPSSSWDGTRERPISPRPAPERRPGLATHWGETRYSPAWQVDFERSDGARPAAMVELHYNDRSGARRMLPNGSWGRAEIYALGGVRLRIVDGAGGTFPALSNGSHVIGVGTPGERYALQIDNPTGSRLEVVASVDGLDVLDGDDASFDKRGYLVAAYSSVTIDGFRRSDAEVAAFRLGDVARSYAGRKGKARNVGVIGFALFEERRPFAEPPPVWRRPASRDTELRRQADPFPGRYARPPVW